MAEFDPISFARLARRQNIQELIQCFLVIGIVYAPLFGFLFIASPPHRLSDKDTPEIEMFTVRVAGDYHVHVKDVKGGAPSVRMVKFILLNHTGNVVHGVLGSVQQIYGLQFDDRYTNISFMDEDFNGKISGGDYFMVKHIENGGMAMSGYSLLLKFETTWDAMNGEGTPLH